MHDVIEICAGDTPLYDTTAWQDQLERERRTADQLFDVLPRRPDGANPRVVGRIRGQVTPEARFAKAMDRLQPLLLNRMARGGTWRSPGVTAEDVRRRKALIGDASTHLWQASRRLIDEGEARGWARSARLDAW